MPPVRTEFVNKANKNALIGAEMRNFYGKNVDGKNERNTLAGGGRFQFVDTL